jgi:hypothetical protein
MRIPTRRALMYRSTFVTAVIAMALNSGLSYAQASAKPTAQTKTGTSQDTRKSECDCAKVPWKPEHCVRECLEKAIKNSNSVELKTFLRLDHETLVQIAKFKKDPSNKALLDLVTSDPFVNSHVKAEAKTLDPRKLNYLLAAPDEKKKVIDEGSAWLPPEVVDSREFGTSRKG